MPDVARLLFPAIRWDARTGFDDAADAIQQAIELGVGGFILFGGEAAAVRDLTRDLRDRSSHPLLIGADLERGAGQQFRGATALPPLAALGWLDDAGAVARAGEVTGREALSLGVNWVYAPMADVDFEPRNPIVGTRSFGSDPYRVARLVATWIRGCARSGALSCAKHFPGHGRTTGDSHLELPVVDASAELIEQDLHPFETAIQAQVDSIMTAHVSYPELDPTGAPATMSAPIVRGMLRGRLNFRGIVVTDALIMEGALEARSEADAAVAALNAGCDALLYPNDIVRVAKRLEDAIERDELHRSRVDDAIAHIADAAARAGTGGAGDVGAPAELGWAAETATRVVHAVRGDRPTIGGRVEIVTVDDDVGGPYAPPDRSLFGATLRDHGVSVEERGATSDGSDAGKAGDGDTRDAGDGMRIIAVYADIRAWKGRPGISEAGQESIARALAGADDAVVVLFGHPRLVSDIEGAATVFAAWGGEAIMQRAAADWLVQEE